MSHGERAPVAVGDGNHRAAGVSDRPVLGGGTREALRGGGKGRAQGEGMIEGDHGDMVGVGDGPVLKGGTQKALRGAVAQRLPAVAARGELRAKGGERGAETVKPHVTETLIQAISK
jgi:hypothetical protein